MGSRKFRFRLESVLNLRKSREETALRMLADAQRAHQDSLARKRELEAALLEALRRREGFGRLASPIAIFGVEQDFIGGTKQRIVQQGQAITRATRGVEKALRSYLLARRQTRTIESLKATAYAEYRKEKARREQRELDDLSIMRARFTVAVDEDGIGVAS